MATDTGVMVPIPAKWLAVACEKKTQVVILTISLLITMIDASNLVCGLLTACPTPSPSCKSIGPVLFNARVLMQPPLTSHLAVQSFASIRGDHFRHNSGDIEAVGFKFRMQAAGMIARAHAKFQGSAMKTVDFVVAKPSFLSKVLHFTGTL